MSLSIDVVVVVHGRYDLTASCLRHLAAQTRSHRVLVCDDASADGSAERLAREWPAVHVERNESNRGFARSCNRAAAAGAGDVVVLLNNDVECPPDFLERLVEPLEREPALGSVAALCTTPGNGSIDSVGLTADPTLSGFPRLRGLPVARAGSPDPVLVGPSGTAAAYRRGAWADLGGLDERIFAYSEDLDLALRLRSAGWETRAEPRAACVHLGSATFGLRTAWQRRQGGFSRGYLVRRYGVLRRRAGLRTAFTEALVVAGDAVLSRDLAALRGRTAGWRAARGLPRRPFPPPAAIDDGIGLRSAIALRRGAYGTR
jgi:GT2 family glycosyltransferase